MNDWLRGERDWRDLAEFFDRIIERAGTACWAQRIQDPEVVAALAELPDPKEPTPPAIEGFGWHEATLTKILDRLTQLLYATSKADPTSVPTEPWPAYPHVAARAEVRRKPRTEGLVLQLIPGGGE